jgi:hypothetical protein
MATHKVRNAAADESIEAIRREAVQGVGAALGPPLPTCAMHKVVNYLGHCGRAGRASA